VKELPDVDDAMTLATTALDSTCENFNNPEDDEAKQEAYEKEYHSLMD